MANDCVACKYIRYFFFAAAPIVILIGMSSGPGTSSPFDFIKIDIGDYLAGGILISLICLVGYRIYIEYYLPWLDREATKDKGCSKENGSAGD